MRKLFKPASVVAVKLRAAPKVDQTLGVHPNVPANLLVEFADVKDATKKEIRWMATGRWNVTYNLPAAEMPTTYVALVQDSAMMKPSAPPPAKSSRIR